MIKRILFIGISILFFACDSENANDCFQTAGTIVQQELSVSSFERIIVNDYIEMVLAEGQTHEVVVETGENLMNDISAEVVDRQLILTNGNVCNFVREFGITKIFVTAPNITEIRSNTRFDIRSESVLRFPELVLLSENFNDEETAAVGNFDLQIENTSLRVTFNNLSSLFLSGRTENFTLNFFANDSRFEGEDFIAQNISIFHRGSNDMVIHPVASLSGSIVSTGDVISVNRPTNVDVEELYTGRLIFTN